MAELKYSDSGYTRYVFRVENSCLAGIFYKSGTAELSFVSLYKRRSFYLYRDESKSELAQDARRDDIVTTKWSG